MFGPMFVACAADTKTKLRLIMAALIYAKREHTYHIDTVSFMLVTANWIPVEGTVRARFDPDLLSGSQRNAMIIHSKLKNHNSATGYIITRSRPGA